MHEFVELQFRSERTGFYFNPKHLSIEPDMHVIAKVERGEDIGQVINCSISNADLEAKKEKGEISKITRIATEEDFKQLEVVKKKEQEAKIKFLEMVKKYPFEMKLLETFQFRI